MEPSISGLDDFVGIGGPCEGFRFCFVVLGDEAVDGGLQVDDGLEDAVSEPSPGQFGEEALDGVEPRTRCWREVEGPARMPVEPRHYLRRLVGGIVVEDDVDDLARRNVALDPVQKANELLMPVALHVLADNLAGQRVEGGKQRGRAIALVIVGWWPRAPSSAVIRVGCGRAPVSGSSRRWKAPRHGQAARRRGRRYR